MKTRTNWFAKLTKSDDATKRRSSLLARVGFLASVALLVSAATGCGSVEKASAQTTSPIPCSVATLSGTYGFQRNGTTSSGPLTAIGIATYDGMGNSTFQQTISRGGTFTTGPVQTVTYTVNPDCTSTAIDSTGAVFSQQVVVHNGSEVIGMSMTAGNNVAIHFERIADPR